MCDVSILFLTGHSSSPHERELVLFSQILNANPELFFRLQQKILIELILDEKEKEAMEFTIEKLVPLVEENVGL